MYISAAALTEIVPEDQRPLVQFSARIELDEMGG